MKTEAEILEEHASAAWESETQVNFNEAEAMASIYTASSRVASMLRRRGLKPVRVDRLQNGGGECGWWFEVAKAAIIIKPSRSAIRIGGGAHRIKNMPLSDTIIAEVGEVS